MTLKLFKNSPLFLLSFLWSCTQLGFYTFVDIALSFLEAPGNKTEKGCPINMICIHQDFGHIVLPGCSVVPALIIHCCLLLQSIFFCCRQLAIFTCFAKSMCTRQQANAFFLAPFGCFKITPTGLKFQYNPAALWWVAKVILNICVPTHLTLRFLRHFTNFPFSFSADYFLYFIILFCFVSKGAYFMQLLPSVGFMPVSVCLTVTHMVPWTLLAAVVVCIPFTRVFAKITNQDKVLRTVTLIGKIRQLPSIQLFC